MTIVKTILKSGNENLYNEHIRRIRAAAKAVQDDVRSTPGCNPEWVAIDREAFTEEGKSPIEFFMTDDFHGITYRCNPNTRTIQVLINTVD